MFKVNKPSATVKVMANKIQMCLTILRTNLVKKQLQNRFLSSNIRNLCYSPLSLTLNLIYKSAFSVSSF